jgi:ABC-type glycerol-3-phosphate transport system substrate-binding protein
VPLLDSDHSRRTLLKTGAAGAGTMSLAVLLAACSGGTAAKTTSAFVAAAAGKAKGKVSQIVIGGNDPSTPAGKSLTAREKAWLKANSGVGLADEGISFDQLITTVLTRARARTLSDVLQLYPGTLFDAVFPVLEPLKRSMFADNEKNLRLWDYTTLKASSSDLAGVPIGNQGGAWYYNKRIFQSVGLDPDTPPQTWDELEHVAEVLKAHGKVPLGMSSGYAGFYLYGSILVQFLPKASDVVDFRAGRIKITDERFRTALVALSKMATSGWFNPSYRDESDDDAVADFANGRVAMYCAQLGSWADFEAKLAPGDFGAFLPPKHPEAVEQVAYVTPDLMYSVNKSTKNPSAALSWINFLASREAQIIGLKVGGTMPNRDDVDVASVVSSPAAAQVADWLKNKPGNEVPLDFFNGKASGTFFAKLPGVLLSGAVDPFLQQLQTEQAA